LLLASPFTFIERQKLRRLNCSNDRPDKRLTVAPFHAHHVAGLRDPADVDYCAHSGLKSDIAVFRRWARSGSRLNGHFI
jgi:hypothetical protein